MLALHGDRPGRTIGRVGKDKAASLGRRRDGCHRRSISIDALAVTAITNFVFAAQVFFLCGMHMQAAQQRGSASWHWGFALLCLAMAALLGGIDHGFVEAANLPREGIRKLTWLMVGGATFFLALTTACQFFSGATARALSALAAAQLAAFVAVVLAFDTFLVVVLNYALVVMLLLVMNVLRLGRGQGSLPMIIGIVLLVLASIVQALELTLHPLVNGDALYHLVAMPALLFMCLGGRRLRPTRADDLREERLD